MSRITYQVLPRYSIIITGWVYPPVSHWAWDGSGWLAEVSCSQQKRQW